MVRIRIKKLEKVARDYAKAVDPLLDLVEEYGCSLVLDRAGDLYVKCRRVQIPVRDWLKIPQGVDEGSRRKGEVYRRTGEPWHPVHNPDSNISFNGFPCADDR